MKNYESWSFRDRSFATALLVSLLWHFFWFFSVTITVSPPKKKIKTPPRVVSLGPVLDDTIFKTLARERPQLSETFYRRSADLSKAADLEVKTLERHEAGEVVSLPFSQKFWSSIKELVGGTKSVPRDDFVLGLSPAYQKEELSEIEGAAQNRSIIHRPEYPEPPAGLDPAFRQSEVELEFTVDPEGTVSQVAVIVSSGSPDVDLIWMRYLRRWQFAPLALPSVGSGDKGRVRFHFQGESRE